MRSQVAYSHSQSSRGSADTAPQSQSGTMRHVLQRSHCTHWSVPSSPSPASSKASAPSSSVGSASSPSSCLHTNNSLRCARDAKQLSWYHIKESVPVQRQLCATLCRNLAQETQQTIPQCPCWQCLYTHVNCSPQLTTCTPCCQPLHDHRNQVLIFRLSVLQCSSALDAS